MAVPWLYTIRKGTRVTANHELDGARAVVLKESIVFDQNEFQSVLNGGSWYLFSLTHQWPGQGFPTLEAPRRDVGYLFRTPSSSNPTKQYETLVLPEGQDWRWSCDCPGWRFPKKGQSRMCKHVLHWQTHGQLPAVA